MKLYEDFAKSRVKKSMDESLSEGERSSKVARTAKTKKETGTVCTHVFQVRITFSVKKYYLLIYRVIPYELNQRLPGDHLEYCQKKFKNCSGW